MNHQRVDAGAAGRWLQRGWNLFTQSAGLWVLLALVMGIIFVVLQFVPLLGSLVGALLMPTLFGGLVYGARELERGRVLELGHLFQAFREPGRAGPMLALGLVPLAAGVMSGSAGAGMASGSGGMGVGMMAGGGMLMMLISLLIGLVSGALLLFAIPRVMFGIDAPMAAIQASFSAVLDNLGAYFVLAVIYFVLAIVAAIPLGLGFLVLLPVMAGAVYTAHAEVFGDHSVEAAPQ
ncbi:BPSS1780 family membrane protein [Halofilum ochraceum]|uniref:BPSS1780 family membrane protein n=1 Tax=Halofilum ochraceum TaxID=1611323 RepID=UPI0008DAE485|nr:BPSS1780 family membrane protein [Halofilum ochraceum]